MIFLCKLLNRSFQGEKQSLKQTAVVFTFVGMNFERRSKNFIQRKFVAELNFQLSADIRKGAR